LRRAKCVARERESMATESRKRAGYCSGIG